MSFDLRAVARAKGKVDAGTAYRAINAILYSIDKSPELITYADFEQAFTKAGFTPLVRVNLAEVIHNDMAQHAQIDPARAEKGAKTMALLVQTFGLDEVVSKRAGQKLEAFFTEQSLKNTGRIWKVLGGEGDFVEAMGRLSTQQGGSEGERRLLVEASIRGYARAIGQDWRKVQVEFFEGAPNEIASYDPNRDVVRVNTRSTAWLEDFSQVLAAGPHEINHRDQFDLAKRLAAGKIPEEHPDYVLAKGYALNLIHYQQSGNTPQQFGVYARQLVEQCSKQVENRFRIAAIASAGLRNILGWVPTEHLRAKVTAAYARGLGIFGHRRPAPGAAVPV